MEDEGNAEEGHEVDDGGDEGDDGGHLGERDDVKGSGGADLLAPSVEEEVRQREEQPEEHGVGEVRLLLGVWVWVLFGLQGFAGGSGTEDSPANFHFLGIK